MNVNGLISLAEKERREKERREKAQAANTITRVIASRVVVRAEVAAAPAAQVASPVTPPVRRAEVSAGAEALEAGRVSIRAMAARMEALEALVSKARNDWREHAAQAAAATQVAEVVPPVVQAEAQATPAAQEVEVGTPDWTMPPGAATLRLNAEIIAASAPTHNYMAAYKAMIAELSSEGEMGEEVAEVLSCFKEGLKEPPGVVELDLANVSHLGTAYKEALTGGVVLAILATYCQTS